ncbi:hypothetical protein [Bacillus alkalicellulosilyticus]|uniref:hypothetical protein n=1 Tax=Alkalihalobacterium alkalicellulosilyticum TaxID=1912214 RepID=UPI000996CCD5|nr:hypothetical protein [Bacillus alkalicellulosilyticus]
MIFFVIILLAVCAEKNSDEVAGDVLQEETNEEPTISKADKEVSSDSGKVEDANLLLGETGIMKSPVGAYEVTVHSVKTTDQVGEFTPK